MLTSRRCTVAFALAALTVTACASAPRAVEPAETAQTAQTAPGDGETRASTGDYDFIEHTQHLFEPEHTWTYAVTFVEVAGEDAKPRTESYTATCRVVSHDTLQDGTLTSVVICDGAGDYNDLIPVDGMWVRNEQGLYRAIGEQLLMEGEDIADPNHYPDAFVLAASPQPTRLEGDYGGDPGLGTWSHLIEPMTEGQPGWCATRIWTTTKDTTHTRLCLGPDGPVDGSWRFEDEGQAELTFQLAAQP